jgi:glucosamine kinase
MVIKNEHFPGTGLLLLGVDGGGTRCRARLSTSSGKTLAQAVAGPANIRLDMEKGLAAVFQAGAQCLTQAGLTTRHSRRIVACLGLAGQASPAAAPPHNDIGIPIVTSS